MLDSKLSEGSSISPSNSAPKRNDHHEALKRSEARLRALASAISDVTYRMSPDWTQLYQLDGSSFLADTGEPIDNWLEMYIHPDDRDHVRQAIQEAAHNKSVFQLEHRILKTDGAVGWISSRAIPILNEQGEIVEWLGAASDITERKRAEEELRNARDESEKRKRIYEAITASTPDLIYVFDLNYRFTYANEALLKMWGRTWEQSIGRGLLELGYEDWHAEMHEREIDLVVATKKAIRGEVSFPHATQGRRVYDYIFVPVINEKGEVEAVAGTTRDITEIKQAEEARKSIMEELEKRVNERTRELHRSNDDLQQFAHVASHDLKEPVRKIKTYANRLNDEFIRTANANAKLYLAKILSSAERMSQMIEGVLSYSSLTAFEEKFEPVDLNEIIRQIRDDLEVLIQEKRAMIAADVLPAIDGFPVLIYQLFYNLINNAIKFSKPDEAPHMRITSHVISLDGQSYTVIKVIDNGIGFDSAYNEKIFETFTRLNARSKYDGTGLGLSLCKKIVQRHQGTIEADGEANKGAVFTITLPLTQTNAMQ